MRLSELLGAEAVDQGGNVLGEVHDVRLREEVTDAGNNRRFVVDGFLVGAGSIGARLGYSYGEVTGPWLLALIMRTLARRARYLPWRDVASFDAQHLVVPAGAQALADAAHPRRGER